MIASFCHPISDLLSLLYSLFSDTVGRISDIWGRKPVLLLSIVGTCASYSLLLLASESQTIFVTSRIIIGLLKNTETSCYSIITDISTPTLRVKRMALVGGAIGLGFIVGPALSGILTSSYSLDTPAYISSIMLALNAIVAFFILPETKDLRSRLSIPSQAASNASSSVADDEITNLPADERVLNSSADMLDGLNDDMVDELDAPLDMLRDSGEFLRASNAATLPQTHSPVNLNPDEFGSETTRRTLSAKYSPAENAAEEPKEEKLSLIHLLLKPNPLRTLVWIYFGISMAVVIFQGSSVLLFQILGISVHTVSWIISYSGLLTVISSFVIQRLSSTYSEKQLLVKSIFVVAVTLFATVFLLRSGGSSALAALLVAYIPLILGARTLKNCLLGLVTQQTPSNQTGTVIGLLNSLESLCRALAPLIGGVLMQYFIGAPALAGSIICFAFLAYLTSSPFSQTGVSSYDAKLV